MTSAKAPKRWAETKRYEQHVWRTTRTVRSSRRRQPDRAAGDSSNECAGQAHWTTLGTKWWSMKAQPGLEPGQERTELKLIHAQARL
eukprot:5581959-Pleurochrysis_carterae.AAC.1